MLMFVIQSALLILIAFVLGCIIGSLLCRMFSSGSSQATLSTPAPEKITPEKPVDEKPVVKATPLVSSKPPVKAKPAARAKPAAKKSTAKKQPIKKPAAKKPTEKKPVAKKKPAAKAPAPKDNLKEIKGIGPQNEARLNKDGTTTFAQIARWSAKQQKEIGERLAFPGRIERENWVTQAKVLAKGGDTEFSKRVARGQVSSSKGRAKK